MVTMDRNLRKPTLNDVVMGKKGIAYTMTEMVTILTYYNITPNHHLGQHRRKLALFQQLHELAHEKGSLSKHDRYRILRGLMRPLPSQADNFEPEESDGEEIEKAPAAVIEPRTSVLTPFTTCSVCFEQYSRHHFARRWITAECRHEPRICLDCLRQAIDSQIGSKSWDKLTCPLCPARLSFETVKAYSSPEHFQKYDRQATMHALNKSPKFCLCLGPGCISGQLHASGNQQPIMTCNVCHFKTCFTHQMPWHEGITCSQYDAVHRQRNEENDASLALVQRFGLVCPSCSAPGIKVSGCDHMTCPRCSYQYCSRCLASYEAIQMEGNTAHKQTCRYHSSRVPSSTMTNPVGFLDENGNMLPWQDEVHDDDDGDEQEVEDHGDYDDDDDDGETLPVVEREPVRYVPQLRSTERQHREPQPQRWRRQLPGPNYKPQHGGHYLSYDSEDSEDSE